MKLFRIRGGVHPAGRKEATRDLPIETMPLPGRLYLPVQQHIGAPAAPAVKVGERVLRGQLLAHSQGAVSAPIHAPTSATVADIADLPAPHPSGLAVRTVVLAPDGLDEAVDRETVADPLSLSPGEIATLVGAAGIVGMGGATFPAAVKLNLPRRQPIHTLVINGAECEPFLTCDERLMRERGDAVIAGIRLMARALGVQRTLVAIEDNKPEARAMMVAAAAGVDDFRVLGVPTRYPMGSEKHLVQTLTGLETPARELTADLGVVVHNVATAHAVYRALYHGEPCISRVVTVSGGATQRPANLEVRLGTRVTDLLNHCGGFRETPARLLAGGPMMGQMLPHQRVPIVKGSSGILALTGAETAGRREMPCIRCGSCVEACPCGLLPLAMAAHGRAGDLEGAARHGLMDCVSCGACAYTCPSHIPLVQIFHHARGALAARQRVAHKAEETRHLSQRREARLAREQAHKAAEAAARKAAREAANKARAAAREAAS